MLELVYFSYINPKEKVAGTIEAMKQECEQNRLQAKAGSRKQPEEKI